VTGVDFPAAAATLAASLSAVIAFLTIGYSPARVGIFLPEIVEAIGTQDSRSQTIAYYVFVLTLLISSATLGVIRWPELASRNSYILDTSITALALFALSAHIYIRSDSAIAAIPVLLFILLLQVKPLRSFLIPIGMFLTMSIVSFAVLPGLIGTAVFPLGYLPAIDAHYAAVLSQGERLAAGKPLFTENIANYGTLVPTLIGLAARISEAPSFGTLVRIVQTAQTLCLAAFLALAYLLGRNSEMHARITAFSLLVTATAAWLSTGGPVVWWPNLSGIRFLMIPVALCTGYLIGRIRLEQSAASAAFVAGTSLLLNLETGLAITAALGLTWLVHARQASRRAAIAGVFLGLSTFALTLVMFAGVYRLSFGELPLPTTTVDYMTWFARGFGGLRAYFEPVFFLLLLHAAYVCARAVRTIVTGETPDGTLTVTAGGLILAWFPFLANRWHLTNLWSFAAIYVVMLITLYIRRPQHMLPVVLAVLVVSSPYINHTFAYVVEPMRDGRVILGRHSGCADGLIMPEKVCEFLAERADTARALTERGEIVWSTSLPLLTMRTTGLRGPLPLIDTILLAPSYDAFALLTARIRELRPSVLLIDDTENAIVPVPKPLVAFNARLIAALEGEYCLSERKSGWVVYLRNGHCSK